MSAQEEDSFRDHINTTDEEGQRSWVYASAPSGRLHNYRMVVAYSLLAVFFLMPFLKINDQPLILIGILERKFVLFGKVFWPQDFHLFVIGLITLIIGIVLFTVIYGRVWCGWTCPQTLFLEMVFRKIEFFIEGSAHQQRKLDNGPLSIEKIAKKAIKHLIFALLSLLIIHTLVSYLIGVNELFLLIKNGPSESFVLFFAIAILSVAFYFVFARFREQVCTLVCPYGRLQGVMLDANSLVVAYDYQRGEQRGRWKKGETRSDAGKGDCIDCGNCITVCPTGIDIRNGTQLECINCTACIDSCNSVMHKIGSNPGLIRIASYKEISEGRKFQITPRIIAYTILLFGLITTMVTLFATRKDTETTILRVPGSLYQDMGESWSNIYNLKIINKSNRDITIDVKPLNVEGDIRIIGSPVVAKSQESAEGVFLFNLEKSLLTSSKLEVSFGIYSEGKLIEKENATFIGP